MVFRPSSPPRSLPAELKSDKDILAYLYRLMQPAVTYLEEVSDVERFASDDAQMNSVFFHAKGDAAVAVFDEVSDQLRDYGRFGRTRSEAAMAEFDVDEAQLPALLIWRTFGANPVVLEAAIFEKEALSGYILGQLVPLLGEFTPATSSRLMQRGLPLLWLAVGDAMSGEQRQALLAQGEALAVRYQGQLTFVFLDVDAQPQIAHNFGLRGGEQGEGEEGEDMDEDEDEKEEEKAQVPQVLIMNQVVQIKRSVDMEDVEGTVQGVIDEYLLQLRISRGQAMGELHADDDLEFEGGDEEDDEEYDTVIGLDAQQGGGEEGEKKDL